LNRTALPITDEVIWLPDTEAKTDSESSVLAQPPEDGGGAGDDVATAVMGGNVNAVAAGVVGVECVREMNGCKIVVAARGVGGALDPVTALHEYMTTSSARATPTSTTPRRRQ
jgi:hypothetical protein